MRWRLLGRSGEGENLGKRKGPQPWQTFKSHRASQVAMLHWAVMRGASTVPGSVAAYVDRSLTEKSCGLL